MSNLVLASQLNIPTKPESALMAAARGELTVEDDPFAELGIDLGEHNNLEGILPDVPMLKVDGSAGVFLEREQDARQAPAELYGLILARQGSKVFFPPRERLLDKAKEWGFRELLAEELKWICRCSNTSRPGDAELNPQLTDAQKAEAERLKIGGATGRGCMGCPAATWYDPGEGESKMRLCKDGENLLWLDSNREEPLVLTIIAASSVVALQKYLKGFFRKGKPVPLFRNLVKLGFEKTKAERAGVKDYYVFQVTDLQPLEKPTLLAVAGAYNANLYLLERASKRVDTLDGHGFESVPAEESSQGLSADEADCLGGVL